MRMPFASTTLGTEQPLQTSELLGYGRDPLASGASLTLTAHAVYLPRPRIEISGPQGVQATFDWQAATEAVAGRMCTVTALAEWEFGGGGDYCEACPSPCRDCPSHLNAPQTPEGWQVWDLMQRLGGQPRGC